MQYNKIFVQKKPKINYWLKRQIGTETVCFYLHANRFKNYEQRPGQNTFISRRIPNVMHIT